MSSVNTNTNSRMDTDNIDDEIDFQCFYNLMSGSDYVRILFAKWYEGDVYDKDAILTILSSICSRKKEPSSIEQSPFSELNSLSIMPVFSEITENIYPDHIDPTAELKYGLCECESGLCGDDSCHNHACKYECTDETNCNIQKTTQQKCENRPFLDSQRPIVEIKKSGSVGNGLYTTEDIKYDSLVIEYMGEILSKNEMKSKYANNYEFYEHHYLLSFGKYCIDATVRGSKARFINHSCAPNCTVKEWIVNDRNCIGIFSKQDITANDELTFNYGFNCFNNDSTTVICISLYFIL